MDIQPLLLSYTAAALVALGVTASFSSSIDQMLFRLLPADVGPHWTRLMKFVVFVTSFGGGLPTGASFDRTPGAPPPAIGEGLMLVMGSAAGALMAASWVLLAFFGVTLAALTAGRAYAAMLKFKEREPRKADDEPLRRREPAEPRPVQKEKSGVTHR